MPGFKDLEEVLDMPAATNIMILNNIDDFAERMLNYITEHPSLFQNILGSERHQGSPKSSDTVVPLVKKSPVRVIRV